ncbi:MAG: DUF1343 domain-containing protein [Opitutaceae bacterium]|nr:DUF1343 domain-containing protein [Opitutaceae bacterium]
MFLGLRPVSLVLSVVLLLAGCATPQPKPQAAKPQVPVPTPAVPMPTRPTPAGPVQLGIDVLVARNFSGLQGKRVALLTHAAGVNNRGISTVDVLRKAQNFKLVSLFGPEHGIYGLAPAGENVGDSIDKRTGLPVYSLHGKNRKPTKTQLKGVDILVIDLQDIGSRSYTYAICMRYAIEACFENGVEVMVLDRPNPLGGLKVDGPILDRNLFSGVGGYPIPYVHGLTIGELARMAAGTPGWLEVPEAVRKRGKLTVVPMSGWRRGMRWPETGLTFTPTSPYVQDFAACVGYAMTGLGTQIGGFAHGVGNQYPFRGLYYRDKPIELIQRELEALRLPGIAFRKISVPKPNGQPAVGVYIEVTDWEDWRPTELSFHLMRLTCKMAGKNVFAAANATQTRSFNIHTGSMEWWNALKRDGVKVNLEAFLVKWRSEAAAFQKESRKYWLYN